MTLIIPVLVVVVVVVGVVLGGGGIIDGRGKHASDCDAVRMVTTMHRSIIFELKYSSEDLDRYFKFLYYLDVM